MAKKDQEINELKYEVNRLSSQIQGLAANKAAVTDVSQSSQKKDRPAQVSSAATEPRGIIRVDAKPEEVQKALLGHTYFVKWPFFNQLLESTDFFNFYENHISFKRFL